MHDEKKIASAPRRGMRLPVLLRVNASQIVPTLNLMPGAMTYVADVIAGTPVTIYPTGRTYLRSRAQLRRILKRAIAHDFHRSCTYIDQRKDGQIIKPVLFVELYSVGISQKEFSFIPECSF